MANIKFDGLEDLQKKLRQNVSLNDVKRVVRQNGAELESEIIKNADFSKGYQTGTTKRSTTLEIKDNGLTADAGPTTEYAPYLEYGTRFMEAQPFVKPAFEVQKNKFKSDLKKLVR